jgi:hypothetical protein
MINVMGLEGYLSWVNPTLATVIAARTLIDLTTE